MKTYTPLQLQSIVAQLRNIRVNGDPVFRVSVEPTALNYRKRIVLDNGDTIANLELELTPRQGGAWNGVLARYGDEENPIDYQEAVKIARKRIGETVPGYYRGEEWVITGVTHDPQSKCVRAVVVDKAVYEVLKEFEQKEEPRSVTFHNPSLVTLESGEIVFKLTEYGTPPDMHHDVYTRDAAINWAQQAIEQHMTIDGHEATDYSVDGNEERGAVLLHLRKK